MIPPALEEAIRERLAALEAALPLYRAGKITEVEMRPLRLALCLHQQANPERFMLRVRIPCGEASAEEVDAIVSLAGAAREPHPVHLTTRQCFQVHDLRLDEGAEAVSYLLDHGLATAGSCGNAVRNVAACERAGICPDEIADAAGVARELSDALAVHPGHPLPRKFKIAVSGCRADCASALMQDAGWVARTAGGPDGPTFDLWGGGGLGARPRAAVPLAEGVPASRVVEATRALVDLFDVEGDRTNRKRARLKFVVERLGAGKIRARLQAALGPLPAPQPRERATPPARPAAEPLAPLRWLRTNVQPQRDPQQFTCAVTVSEGDIRPAELRVVADAARRFGSGKVRLTDGQNLLVPGVPAASLADVHQALAASGLGRAGAGSASDPAACPGKDVCALAFTRSRNAARAIRERLACEEALVAALGRCRIQVSGCPNGCARHALAHLGAQGLVRGAERRPFYRLWSGGECAAPEPEARLANPLPGAVAEADLAERVVGELRQRASRLGTERKQE